MLDVLAEELLNGLGDLSLLLRDVMVMLGVVSLRDTCRGHTERDTQTQMLIQSDSLSASVHYRGSRRCKEYAPLLLHLTYQFVLFDETPELSSRDQLTPLPEDQLQSTAAQLRQH